MSPFRFLGLLLVVTCYSEAAGEFDVRAHYDKFEYRIPMRDGTRLFTIVYAPKEKVEKYPLLLTRTPYSIAPYGPNAYAGHVGPSIAFASDKFIFVYQDVRGRFQSEGVFVDTPPLKDRFAGPQDTDETTDSYDTIEWLLKNVPNNNGKVGIYGTSYAGFYTACALVRPHPALVAASPQAPMADLYMGDDAYHNGAFFLAANFDFYSTFDKQHNPLLPSADRPKFDYGTKDGYQFYLQMGALANSDQQYLLFKNPYWTDAYTHTTYDEFWKPRNILPHLNGSAGPAVLVVGGWYDAQDLAGTLKTYQALNQQPAAALATRIVMGPWEHGGWSSPGGDKLGNIAFGADTADFFRAKIELPFFREYLKGAPASDLPKAYMFETGKNRWKMLPQWPPAGTHPVRLYFRDKGKLAVKAPLELAGQDEYVSDANDPVSFFDKPATGMNPDYMVGDQRFLTGRKDVLTYVTDPLTEDFTVAGPVSPTLFVSTSGTDSDFDVKLIDVYPDAPAAGSPPATSTSPPASYQQLVRGEPFRGKFRNSFEKPEPFQPGVQQQIHWLMPDVYHCFLRGHRIMVQVQSSWFPLTDRNPQTYTDIPNAKPEQFVKVTERIYRSRRAASFVEVNVEQ